MKKFFESLGVEIRKEQLYTTALTHKSYANEKKTESNERLEFLGDAVLELAVTQALYKKYPKLPEGELTALRSALVRKESLAQCAIDINLPPQILVSVGERKHKGNQKDYIMANTIEAILGAIYLDRGFAAAQKFVNTYFIAKIEDIHKEKAHIGPKTILQEYTQGKLLKTPVYKVLEETGLDHAKNFIIGVFVGKKQIGIGEGPSKQKAQINAAIDANEQLNLQ